VGFCDTWIRGFPLRGIVHRGQQRLFCLSRRLSQCLGRDKRSAAKY
jgi:hypothetical protein